MAVENLEPPRSRPRTVQITRMSKYEIQRGTAETPPDVNEEYDYPHTRGDCLQGEHQQRPCPFVSCKHHLFLDVSEVGNIKLNHPDTPPEAMGETCALDLADRGGMTLEEVGAVFGVTRERIRQIEFQALRKLRKLPMADKRALIDLLERDVSSNAEGCSHVSAKHAGP